MFSTLVNKTCAGRAARQCLVHRFLRKSFIDPLEAGLGVKSSHTIGRSHSAMDKKEYQQRIEAAINFAMAHDDGASHRELAPGRRDPDRRIAQREDADQPIPGDAIRREGRELSADPRGP